MLSILSTFTTYRMLASDIQKTISRTATDPQVAREQKYYQDNIGKVKSVDDFLKDQRLYTYAMKAYGLEDMIESKAMMRKVLLSDLTDQNSFARRLVDPRYATFARAFNFTTTGTVPSSTAIAAQDSVSQDKTMQLYSERRIRSGAAIATEANYFQNTIGSVRTVDDFLNDSRLMSFALNAWGINPSIASTSAIKAVLTSDLSDPQSVANTMDARYQGLAAAFSFPPDGVLDDGQSAQTSRQLSDLVMRAYESSGNSASPAAAAFQTATFNSRLASITNVDDLLADNFLVSYIGTAVGLGASVLPSTLRAALTADLSDPDSLQSLPQAYRTAASAFNFLPDGSISADEPVQTEAQRQQLADGYTERFDDMAESSDKLDITFYKMLISKVKSSKDLVGTPAIYNVALKSFDLDPTKESKETIRKVLESDLSDPGSFVNRQTDKRYRALAAAFSFANDGTVRALPQAQLATSQSDTIKMYLATLGTETKAQDKGKVEATYYASAIASIKSVDDLLTDSRALNFVLQANGIKPGEVSNDVIRRLLTSDMFDPKSFGNTTSDPRLHKLATMFNFDTKGKAIAPPITTVQGRDGVIRTMDAYNLQAIEDSAGEDNVGVRLALYFRRKAPSVSTVYDIMGDKALFEVARTTLGLPEEMVKADVEKQGAMITKKLNLADLKDPKKLEAFITKFTSLYDATKAVDSSNNPILALFGR